MKEIQTTVAGRNSYHQRKRISLSHHNLLRRTAAFVCIIFAFALLPFSCGRYYTAEITGYVKDDDSEEGINGAVIKMYLNEEDIAEDAYIVKTASMSSSSNDGYYNHKIIWQKLFGEFGAEGDSGEIWLTAEHEDYLTTSVSVTGIISDTVNVIPDVLMSRSTFETEEVFGRVIDVNGDGVNGVRVVLDLDSTEDEDEDYVAITAASGGTTGIYTFNNVTWHDDEAAGQNSDTEGATIAVDDTDYNGDETLTVTLTSGSSQEINNDITVTRKPRTGFTARVEGQVLRRITLTQGSEDIPIQGLPVKCSFDDSGGGTTTLWGQTDNNGTYSFSIEWQDSVPGDFDVEGDNDGADDGSIPEGEDGLLITVEIDPEGDSYPLTDTTPADGWPDEPPAPRHFEDFKLKSWLNPNYLPDSVDES